MRTKDKFEEEVLGEIPKINPKKRPKLFEIVRCLQMDITESSQVMNIKRFAGIWRDLSEDEINTILSIYNERELNTQERQLH